MIRTQGGKLLVDGGKLASGAGCCCGQCNPATCPTGTECQPPCVCVDGQCVDGGGAGCSGPCYANGDCSEGCSCNCVWDAVIYVFDENGFGTAPESCPPGFSANENGYCVGAVSLSDCQQIDSTVRSDIDDFYGGPQGQAWDDLGVISGTCVENPFP